MRRALALLMGSLAACAHGGAPEPPTHRAPTAPTQRAAPGPAAVAPLPRALPDAPERAIDLLPARVQVLVRLDVAQLAPALGGHDPLAALLPHREALAPDLWQRLIARSHTLWLGADLRRTDAHGYPERLLVLDGDFASLTDALLGAAAIAAPSASTPARTTDDRPERARAEPFGTRYVVVGAAQAQLDAQAAAQDSSRRLAVPAELHAREPSGAFRVNAALVLWALLDEPTVREWTGPLADAFLRPVLLHLHELSALYATLALGPDDAQLALALQPRDPGQLPALEGALQKLLDAVKLELRDAPEALRALYGEPRALRAADRVHAGWRLPSGLVIAQLRATLR